MNISIWDLDWFYKKTTMPNINCMRLSSYHKQKGDKINFITEEIHLNLAFDVLYITKELDITPMPNRKYIDDKRTILIGRGFKYYNTKELNAIITACRPDYLLYENKENNSYTNANFITFYAGNKLIKKRQDWHNTKQNHKKTIVTDKYFWKASDNDILYCLEELKNEKNIVFLEPISLSRIITNDFIQEKFLQLHFSIGTNFKWKNDYSSEYADIYKIILFLQKLKEKTKSDLGFIPIKSCLLNHYDNKYNIDLDLLRCFQIVNSFKSAKLKCVIICSKDTSISPLYPIFYGLELWTRYFFKLSYIEFIVHDICLREGLTWYAVLNNPIKWKNIQIDNLLYLLTDNKWEDNKNLLFKQWGYEELNNNKIDYNIIKQNINLLYKDMSINE